jgi:hypothetical protein
MSRAYRREQGVAVAKRRIGLEVGARQVVQQHVEGDIEQIPPALDQMIEYRLPGLV